MPSLAKEKFRLFVVVDGRLGKGVNATDNIMKDSI